MAPHLERLVTGAHRRATLVGMLHVGGVGAVFGAATGALVLLVAWTLGRFAIAVPMPLAGAASMIGVGIFVGAVWALAHRPARLAVAVRLDRALGLRDRLGTAESLRGNGRLDADVARLVLADAERHALGLSPKVAFPLRGGAWWLGAFVLGAIVLGGGWFLPPPAIAARATVASIPPDPLLREESKSTVDQVLREIRERPVLPPEVGGDALAMLDAIAEQLERGEQSPEELQAARDRAAAAISELGDELAERSQREQSALDEMAAEFASLVGDEPAPPDLTPFVEALRDGRLDDAADALASLRSRLDEMTPDDRAALAEFFDRLADDLARDPIAAPPADPPAVDASIDDDQASEPTPAESDDQTAPDASDEPTTDPRSERPETGTETGTESGAEAEAGEDDATRQGGDPTSGEPRGPGPDPTDPDATDPGATDPGATDPRAADPMATGPDTNGDDDRADEGTRPDPGEGAEGDPAARDESPTRNGAAEPGGDAGERQRAMEEALREMAERMREGACESGQPCDGEEGQGEGEQDGPPEGGGVGSQPEPGTSGAPQPGSDAQPGDGPEAADDRAREGDRDGTQEHAREGEVDGDAETTRTTEGGATDPSADGDRGSDPSLERMLRDMAEGRRGNEERLEQARRLREQAERLAERTTPEERERLRRWSDLAQRERSGDDGRGGARDQPQARPDDRTVRRSPPAPHAGPEIDLTESDGSASVLAELLGGEPAEGGRSVLPPPAARAIREAAERGVEPGELPARYHRLIRRYFGRLEETATEARDQSPGRTP